ncbi:hypothetical protein HBI82_169160 [Parastagonospora nodorum]|nr:hypothetical protein HBI82_169160 [Parastagonospora nodorum]
MLVQTSGEDLLAAPSVRIGPTSCMRQRGARPGAMPLSATHGPREVIMDSITLYNPPFLGAAGDRVRVVLAGARDGCSVVVVVGQGTNLGGRKPLRDRRRCEHPPWYGTVARGILRREATGYMRRHT